MNLFSIFSLFLILTATTTLATATNTNTNTNTDTDYPSFAFYADIWSNARLAQSPAGRIVQVLDHLGYHRLAEAYASTDFTDGFMEGPTTIFVPTDKSAQSADQAVPLHGFYSYHFLMNEISNGALLTTYFPTRSIIITRRGTDFVKLFINGGELTAPHIYESSDLLVHGVDGFEIPLNSSFAVHSHIMYSFVYPNHLPSSYLTDVIDRLRICNCGFVSQLIHYYFELLLRFDNLTILALKDDEILSDNHHYLSTIPNYIIPNHYLTYPFPSPNLTFPTLNPFFFLTLNQSLLSRLDIVSNRFITVHLLSSPLPSPSKTSDNSSHFSWRQYVNDIHTLFKLKKPLEWFIPTVIWFGGPIISFVVTRFHLRLPRIHLSLPRILRLRQTSRV